MKMRDVLAEAWAMVRSQKVSTALTAVVVASMCLAVLLTAGRTNASQQQVLDTIDSQASRTVTAWIEPGAGITMDIIDSLGHIQELEWVATFGAVEDVHNPATQSDVAPARSIIVMDLTEDADRSAGLGIGGSHATPQAAEALGLIDGTGYVIGNTVQATVTRTQPLPDFLTFLDPIVLTPVPETHVLETEPAALIVGVPRSPHQVNAIATAFREILEPAEDGTVSIETSSQVNTLRSLVETQLGGVYQSLILGLFAILMLLVGALMYGLVMIRRRDFGRRRALGSTRSLIITLVLTGTAITAMIAAFLASGIAVAIMVATGNPLPAPEFITATGALAVLAALLGSVIPALIASRRDPLTELRVP